MNSSSLKHQWLGKPFWITLGGLFIVFLLSILVFHNLAEPFALGLMGLAILVLTIKKLEYGLLAAFAELFANSHGHLISAEVGGFSLSLRMTIFLAVMFGWLILILMRKVKLSWQDKRLVFFLPLFVAVATGYIIGLGQNEVAKAFNDGNAYFYLAYLFPVLSVDWDVIKQRRLLQVLAAAAAWVTLLTLGLLYEFTHFPAWMLSSSYTYIRDTRTGELTRMTDSLFRVFLQAQFSLIVFIFFLMPFIWFKETSRRTRIWLVVILTPLAGALLISLSRSFWLGIIAGGLVMISLLFFWLKPTWKKIGSSLGLSFLAPIAGVILLVLIILFPLPYRTGSAGELSGLFSSRTTDTEDAAVSSRWKLLPEIWKGIAAAPLLGQGFGEEVTFQTDDPRVRAFSPDGTWQTYSLEWGWFELWLKMGILGPLAFILLFGFLMREIIIDKKRPIWLTVGLASGLVMLYVTHVFSPYLNHPIGLGFLLFIVSFLEPGKSWLWSVSIKSKLPATKLETTMAAPITKQSGY
ncbi:MAG: O-antigen ligase family protein [Candidatus Uhrbacteria bacterium]